MDKAEVTRIARLEQEWGQLPLVKRYCYFYTVVLLIVAVAQCYRAT